MATQKYRPSKPYIAFTNDNYIQLHIPELCMYKQIWHSHYCDIVINSFLVKHNSKHSCDSAIYYNLSREVIDEFCTFEHFYNTTVMPSVLDRGPLILLANMLTPKETHMYLCIRYGLLCPQS